MLPNFSTPAQPTYMCVKCSSRFIGGVVVGEHVVQYLVAQSGGQRHEVFCQRVAPQLKHPQPDHLHRQSHAKRRVTGTGSITDFSGTRCRVTGRWVPSRNRLQRNHTPSYGMVDIGRNRLQRNRTQSYGTVDTGRNRLQRNHTPSYRNGGYWP